MAIGTIGLIGAGIGLGGNYLANEQQKEAAEAIARQQREANERARREGQAGYDDIYSMQSPYITSGRKADEEYESRDFSYMPGEFEYSQTIGDFLDPSMDFQIEQAMRPIESSAAAGGSLGSGATLKALQREGQRVANMNYGQAFDRMNRDKSFTYNQYLNNANMRRQQLADQERQLLNIGDRGYNTTQNLAQSRQGLANTMAGLSQQAGNIAPSQAIQSQTNAANIRAFTDPRLIGTIAGGINNLFSTQTPQLTQQPQNSYTGMGSTSYQPANPTDWFTPRGGNL